MAPLIKTVEMRSSAETMTAMPNAPHIQIMFSNKRLPEIYKEGSGSHAEHRHADGEERHIIVGDYR